jgi:hypothetical protein
MGLGRIKVNKTNYQAIIKSRLCSYGVQYYQEIFLLGFTDSQGEQQ